MEKERVITKYDYLRYFTRISRFWFHTNRDIELYLQEQLKGQEVDEDDEENEQKDEQDLEFEIFNLEELSGLDQGKDQKTIQMHEGNLIEERFVEYIKNEHPDLRFVDLRPVKNMDALQAKTREAIAADNCLILQATFFAPTFNAVCKTDVLLVKDGRLTLIEVKGTTSVKRKHFLDVYYQYRIAKDAGYHLAELRMGLIRYEMLDRGQISFCTTDMCRLSTENWSGKTAEHYKEKYGDDIVGKQAMRLAALSPTRFRLADAVLSTPSCQTESKRSLKTWNDFWDNFWHKHGFEKVIETLREHKFQPLAGRVTAQDLDYNDTLTSVFYEYAIELRAIVGKKDEKYSYSGMIVPLRWKTIQRSGYGFDELVEKIENEMVYAMVKDGTDQIDKKNLRKELARLAENRVYFDFESINPAIRAADRTFPFQQVVTQCSVIRSNEIKRRNNLICDPQKISPQWWKDVVDSIYWTDDCSYVVYNKTFETSRLKEIKKMIDDESYGEKIKAICTQVFDLADVFTVSKKMAVLAELRGYYSIKKVLPVAAKQIDNPISYDYKKLEVQNGSSAMDLTMQRHFGLRDDKEWAEDERRLRTYCENDVLAMIDVLALAKKLLDDKVH